MSSTTWITELQDNGPDTILKDARIYLHTIRNKENHISFIEENLDKDMPTGDLDEIKQKKLQLEIYLEALVYNLHSLPDVMAQLIVVTVIKPLCLSLKEDLPKEIKVPEGTQITTNNVISKLQELESALVSCPKYVEEDANLLIKEIKDSFQCLLSSDEFKYIYALVNTIKHRHLIDIQFTYKRSQGKVEENDWKFLSFTRDGITYPEITVAKLLSQYKNSSLELFHIVGNKINSYVLAEKL